MTTKALSIKKRKKYNKYIKLAAGIIAYRLSLVFSFFVFVLAYYKDNYFVDTNIVNFCFSYIIFLLSVYTVVRMVKNRAEHLSGHLFLLAYLFCYVPSSVLCSYMWNNYLYTIVSSLFWILTMVLLSFKNCKIKKKELNAFKSLTSDTRSKLFNFIVAATIVFVILIIYSFNHFNFSFSLFYVFFKTRQKICHFH